MTHLDIAQVLAGKALLTEPSIALETEASARRVTVLDLNSDFGADKIKAVIISHEDYDHTQIAELTVHAGTVVDPGDWATAFRTIPHHGARLVPHATHSVSTSKEKTSGSSFVVSCRLFYAHTPPSPVTPQPSALILALKLLASREGLLQADQITALQRQLAALLDADDPSEQRVSLLSLDGLISFLAQHRPAVHPNLSLTADGRFSASWQHGRRAKLTLTFDREGGDWVGVDLDAKRRAVGAFVVHSLAGITQPYRSWMKVEG